MSRTCMAYRAANGLSYALCSPSTILTRSLSSTAIRKKESPRQLTHYEIFPTSVGCPPPDGPFSIDIKRLRQEFIQLQAKAHPDMHAGQDKARAEGLSTRINEAYKTLQDPLRRAQYLLSLRGIEIAEDESAKVEDPELLMEVLEAREAIEDAESEEDLMPMKKVNHVRMQDSEAILEKAFKADDLDLAKSEAIRLQYWRNIDDSITAWQKGQPVVLDH